MNLLHSHGNTSRTNEYALMRQWEQPGFESLYSLRAIDGPRHDYGTEGCCRQPLYVRGVKGYWRTRITPNTATGCMCCLSGFVERGHPTWWTALSSGREFAALVMPHREFAAIPVQHHHRRKLPARRQRRPPCGVASLYKATQATHTTSCSVRCDAPPLVPRRPPYVE